MSCYSITQGLVRPSWSVRRSTDSESRQREQEILYRCAFFTFETRELSSENWFSCLRVLERHVVPPSLKQLRQHPDVDIRQPTNV